MSRLSNVQTNAASSSCPNAGSSSEHLLGLGDAAGLPRTGSVSIKKRSHSLSSPLSASCSENYAIQRDLSGQTLRQERAILIGLSNKQSDHERKRSDPFEEASVRGPYFSFPCTNLANAFSVVSDT